MKINCSVNNCSHNKTGVCFSNRVDMAGGNAKDDSDTCCGSFLNKANYSNLTNESSSNNPCDCLVCQVDSCTHNSNKICQLDSISVNGFSNTELYTQTNCKSFSSR